MPASLVHAAHGSFHNIIVGMRRQWYNLGNRDTAHRDRHVAAALDMVQDLRQPAFLIEGDGRHSATLLSTIEDPTPTPPAKQRHAGRLMTLFGISTQ